MQFLDAQKLQYGEVALLELYLVVASCAVCTILVYW